MFSAENCVLKKTFLNKTGIKGSRLPRTSFPRHLESWIPIFTTFRKPNTMSTGQGGAGAGGKVG